MREILFRGKQAVSGEWVYGSLITETNPFDKDMVVTHIYDKDFNEILVDPETVGQYTGLTDKNAKKIFEHDILKAYDPLDKRYFIGVVKYFDASFYICDTNSVPCYFGEYSFTDFEVEVIGNIYDNPELMGGEANG